MNLDRLGRKLERRRGPDLWVRMLECLGIVGWLLMFVAILVVGEAKPQLETFFERYYHIQLRTTWNRELVDSLFYLMVLSTCLSLSGLIINKKRHRRENDEYRVSLILVGIISFFGIAAYLFWVSP